MEHPRYFDRCQYFFYLTLSKNLVRTATMNRRKEQKLVFREVPADVYEYYRSAARPGQTPEDAMREVLRRAAEKGAKDARVCSKPSTGPELA